MSEQLLDPSLGVSTYTRGEYTISTDPARIDAKAIYAYLSRSYWASARPFEMVELSLRHSLNFGLYHTANQGDTQVGFARVITDYATFAYLNDIYILEDHRGHGLGKWLVETLMKDPALKNVLRFMLATRDAHGLYAQFGFVPQAKPEYWMEHRRPKLWLPIR